MDFLRDLIREWNRGKQKCRDRVQKHIVIVQAGEDNDLLWGADNKNGKILIGLDWGTLVID